MSKKKKKTDYFSCFERKIIRLFSIKNFFFFSNFSPSLFIGGAFTTSPCISLYSRKATRFFWRSQSLCSISCTIISFWNLQCDRTTRKHRNNLSIKKTKKWNYRTPSLCASVSFRRPQESHCSWWCSWRGGDTECLTYFLSFFLVYRFIFNQKKYTNARTMCVVCCGDVLAEVFLPSLSRGFLFLLIFLTFGHFLFFSLCFFFWGCGTWTSTACFSNAPTQTTNWKHFWFQPKRRYRIVTHLIPTQFLSCFFLGVCLFVCSNSEVEKNVGQLVPIFFFSYSENFSKVFFSFTGEKGKKNLGFHR